MDRISFRGIAAALLFFMVCSISIAGWVNDSWERLGVVGVSDGCWRGWREYARRGRGNEMWSRVEAIAVGWLSWAVLFGGVRRGVEMWSLAGSLLAGVAGGGGSFLVGAEARGV